MKKRENIIVKFSGLKSGLHQFVYEVGDRFFDSIENGLIRKGEITVNLDLYKQNDLIQLKFYFSGKVNVLCDRCLCNADIPLEGTDTLVVRFGHDMSQEDPNLLMLPPGEHEVDVTQFVYEMIALGLPAKAVPCEITANFSLCDQEVLQRLQQMETDEPQNHGSLSLKEKLTDLKNKN